jgi:hypothetical protein
MSDGPPSQIWEKQVMRNALWRFFDLGNTFVNEKTAKSAGSYLARRVTELSFE